MGCCLGGCLRLVLFAFWRALFAGLLAIVLARIDDYVARGRGETPIGKAWRLFGRRATRGARSPRRVDEALRTEDRPRP